MNGENVQRAVNGTRQTLEWIWRIAAVVVVPLFVSTTNTMRDLDKRVTVLESNMPTVREIVVMHNEMRREFIEELRLLRAEIDEREP